MSLLSDPIIEMTWTADPDAVGHRASRNRRSGEDALGFTLAGVELAEGMHLQVGGYRPLSVGETVAVSACFRASFSIVARHLLAAHPKVGDELRGLKWVANKLERGKLRRRPPEVQALIILYNTLLDVDWVTSADKRGLFDWDTDGSHRSALGMSWLWRRTYDHHAWPTPTLPQMSAAGEALLDAQLKRFPSAPAVRLAHGRAALAWRPLDAPARSRTLATLAEVADVRGTQPRERNLRLLAQAGRAGAGLRLREPAQAREGLEGLGRELGTRAPASVPLKARQAWLGALTGSPTQALVLARQLESGPESQRFEAAMLYSHLGRAEDERRVRTQLPEPHQPRVSKLFYAR